MLFKTVFLTTDSTQTGSGFLRIRGADQDHFALSAADSFRDESNSFF